ncbi:hypothetical protein ACOSQ4_025264 [Xanthoceras sorbifolium]
MGISIGKPTIKNQTTLEISSDLVNHDHPQHYQRSICFCFTDRKQKETKHEDSVRSDKSLNSHRKSGKNGRNINKSRAATLGDDHHDHNVETSRHGGGTNSSTTSTTGHGADSGMALAVVTAAHISFMEGSGCGSAHGGGGGGGDGG